MAVTVDINPWGKVLDYHSEGAVAEVLRAVYLKEGRLVLEDIRDQELDIRSGCYTFQLRVNQTLGGNQWNVWKNLSVLKNLFPALDVHPHFGLGDEQAVARRALYLPGLPKVGLTRPSVCGHLLFERAPLDQNFMISSAPHGEGSEPYWEAMRAYLRGPGTGKFYLNPGSQQLNGSIPPEVFKALQGRMSIFQSNETEAAIFEAKRIIQEEKLKMKEGLYKEAEMLVRDGIVRVLSEIPEEVRDRKLVEKALAELRVVSKEEPKMVSK